MRISKAFLDFDPQPLAAASLGQVHRARLRDGRPVAVKVQRPNIRQTILEDLEAFAQIAAMADKHTEIGRQLRLPGRCSRSSARPCCASSTTGARR